MDGYVSAVVGSGRAVNIFDRQYLALAQRDFKNDIAPTAARATLITKDPPTEYRAGVLPAWQVELEHSRDPHIYIDAQTGAITARRNWLWRTFDFFWMLHTMDYAGRDNFNHLLLTSFSVLAVLSSSCFSPHQKLSFQIFQ